MEETIGRLKGITEGIEDALRLLNKTLYGNGQPGLLERFTRSEENIEKLAEDFKESQNESDKQNAEIKKMIYDLSENVKKLSEVVIEHHNNKDLHSVKGLFLNTKIIPWVILAFIVLHEFIPQIDIIEFIKHLFGL